MSRLRVVLLVDVFPPYLGGGATRALRIVESMLALDWDVTVVTTSSTYPIGKSILAFKYTKEQKNNFEIIRVPSLNLPFKGLLNRILNYSFSGFSLLMVAAQVKKINLIFSIGMHPFTDLSAILTRVNNPKSRIVVDISDLLPEESLFRAGSQILNEVILSISDSITLHNERMANVFKLKFKYPKQIVVLHNAVDTTVFKPDRVSQKKKATVSNLCGIDVSNRFVLCYFGVLGPFQGLTKIISAATKLQKEFDEVIFLIIGDGEEKNKLQNLASGLKNVFLLPKMEREKIVQVAAEIDIGLVPLVSSESFGCLRKPALKSGRIFIQWGANLAGKGTFIGALVSEFGAGYEVDFNEIEDICNAIRHICSHKKKS